MHKTIKNMNMTNKAKKSILILLFVLLLPIVGNSQQIEDEIKKISLKLEMDKTYLNLKYLNLQLDSTLANKLKDIPRTNSKNNYSFSSNNTTYRIVFLNKGIDLDSIYIMYIDEIKLNTLTGESFFVDETVKDDTTQVLSFRDLFSLKLQNSEQYKLLLEQVIKFVDENEGEILPSLLAIQPDKREKSYMGMTSKDNTDYFNFQKINSPHYIPSEEKVVKSIRSSETVGKDFRIDASFTRLTFSLKSLDYSIGSTGFELSTAEPILNLLPLESSNIFLGFRSIFRISSEKRIANASFIDAKLLARINTNNADLYSKQPFAMVEDAKLNLNSGFGGELNLTRTFGLPFFTIKGFSSSTAFENPTYLLKSTDSTNQAFFSNSQFEATFSFFWNGNIEMTSRFKFNFGIGYFDIWRAEYNANNQIIYSDIEGESHFVPVFEIQYNFVPSGIELLGANMRVFDSRLTVGGWIKIFEFEPENVIRFEAFAITEPLTRSLRTWESAGGLFFQFRYRYGL